MSNTKLSLERTVQWCVDNIDNIYNTSEILSKFGIKVVGQVATADELAEKFPPETYAGEYGDAVLVGKTTPYDFYIWTRPFEGQILGSWLNIGQFPLAGPVGEKGETGSQGYPGTPGSKWHSGSGKPTGTEIGGVAVNVGDFYLTTGGDVYRYTQSGWNYFTSLKGETGIGVAGPAGPAGPIVDIIGVITSVNQLPDPYSVPRQSAYLLGSGNDAKHVYAITGPDNNLKWSNLGLFATGTLATLNGIPQESVELSNYVPFVPGTAGTQVTTYSKSNNQFSSTGLTIDPANYTIPMRTGSGQLRAAAPVENDDCATKGWTETQIQKAHGGYAHPFIITWREWVETDPDTGEGYDETYSDGPFYIKLVPGMDFYIDVAFESYLTPLVQPFYKSGNNWYPIWERWGGISSLTSRSAYHFTVSQLEDGSMVLRTETLHKDDYGNPTTTQVVINGYDMIGQWSNGYDNINLKIGLDEDSYPDMYNTIFYTGNTQPTYSQEFIP